MAFGIGIHSQGKDAGALGGKQTAIACKCWFNSRGEGIPLMIKFQDENGEIQTVREIHVNYTEKKYYAGVASMEYDCHIVCGGKIIQVKITFLQESGKWVMRTMT